MKVILKIEIVYLICFLLLAGCKSFTSLNPAYPPVGNPNQESDKVENNRPTIEWQAAENSTVLLTTSIFLKALRKNFSGKAKKDS